MKYSTSLDGCQEREREQQNTEQEYYQKTLGFGGSYLFADNLEAGRLLVVNNRGFLPIESLGTLPPEGTSIRRLPVFQKDKQLVRNYCAFWRKDQCNNDIAAFAETLRQCLAGKAGLGLLPVSPSH